MWVWAVVLVAIIGGVAVVAVGRDDEMAEVYDDRPDTTIPTGRPLTADDLAAVRFTTGLRGYRMHEVDALLARVRADLLARETAEAAEMERPGAFDDDDEVNGAGAVDDGDRADEADKTEEVDGRDDPDEAAQPADEGGGAEDRPQPETAHTAQHPAS